MQRWQRAQKWKVVSIPNGKPGPLRRGDAAGDPGQRESFNPKREARPSQTSDEPPQPAKAEMFQSQTGSQALSDAHQHYLFTGSGIVSIPNGKPGPLRRSQGTGGVMSGGSFNPKREARPSQTGNYPSLLNALETVSIPNGKPGPLRRRTQVRSCPCNSVSIPNGKPGPLRPARLRLAVLEDSVFQSQTGSQALSDVVIDKLPFGVPNVSIPNGKPGPLRRLPPAELLVDFDQFQSQTGSQALSDLIEDTSPVRPLTSFNPKREARPSQTPA